MKAALLRALRLAGRDWPLLLTAASFLISRIVYRAGYRVRFDPSPVDSFIQYLDAWFFEHDFARSILYLHHQAPLQNLLVGLPLRLLGRTHAFFLLDALYIGFGLALVLAMLHAMLQLRAQPLVAALTCSLYAASPTTVLYENWLFYHLPVACCLGLSLVALLRYLRLGTFGSGLAFFALIATAALFRSIFGPLFVAAVVALLLVRPPPLARLPRSSRTAVLRVAALPLLVLVLNSARPSLLVGYGYGEAMLWGNLVTKVFDALPAAERTRLLQQREISRAATLFGLADLNMFGALRIPHAATGVPLLDMERTPDGRANTHALEYLLIARKYYKPDALYLLSHYPREYAQSVGHALSWYASAATTDPTLPISSNYSRLRDLFERIDRYCGPRKGGRLLLLMIMLPLIVAAGVWMIARANTRLYRERCAQTAIAYMLLTIAYVTAVTTLISYGDFSRYRYEIDPFYLVIFAVALSGALRAARRLREGRDQRWARKAVSSS